MGFACIAITIVIYSWVFWNSANEQALSELDNTVHVVTQLVADSPNIQKEIEKIGKSSGNAFRVTWIGRDGAVLYESQYDQHNMENHVNRPEIQQALKTGSGSSVRTSETLDKIYYYEAAILPDGTILRLSIERASLYSHFWKLLPILLLMIGLTALGCIRASQLLTKSLLKPLRRTALIMEHIGTPDDIRNKVPPVYSELRPLVEKILGQSEVIDHTIQRLEQQRNVVKLMMENLQEGVILTNMSFEVLAINHQALDVLGLRHDLSVTGLRLGDIFKTIQWGPIENNKNDDFDAQFFEKDDRLYQVAIQYVSKEETCIGILFIIYDVTEREKREQLRREFTSNVSHELKTPLTSIKGFAEILSTGLCQSKDDASRFGKLIYDQSQRLLELIEEIIHLSHIEEPKRTRPRQWVTLKAVVEQVLEFMAPVVAEKQVSIHSDVDDSRIWGEEGRIREVVMNLLDNAVKYNYEGGHVYITVTGNEKGVHLVVKDTGMGIPKDKQSRVFERFYRADESRSQDIKGTGLGLSIVKHIVESHHGRITLESEENKGTCITVQFPVSKEGPREEV